MKIHFIILATVLLNSCVSKKTTYIAHDNISPLNGREIVVIDQTQDNPMIINIGAGYTNYHSGISFNDEELSQNAMVDYICQQINEEASIEIVGEISNSIIISKRNLRKISEEYRADEILIFNDFSITTENKVQCTKFGLGECPIYEPGCDPTLKVNRNCKIIGYKACAVCLETKESINIRYNCSYKKYIHATDKIINAGKVLNKKCYPKNSDYFSEEVLKYQLTELIIEDVLKGFYFKERKIYGYFHQDFKEAMLWIENDDWDYPVEVWNTYKSSYDPELSSISLHNLAVYYEKSGNTKRALQFAERAIDIKYRQETQKIINDLK